MKHIYKNKFTLILLAVVAAGVVGGAFYVHNQNQKITPVGTSKHAGPDTDTKPASASSASSATQAPATTTNPSHPASATLAKPIGPNDNTSTVSLSGATGMESTCRSVAGASCYIQATMNGQVVIVSDTKTIGSDPSSDGVILDWDAKKLSAGTWNIQAVASKDGSTAASDPEPLTVKP